MCGPLPYVDEDTKAQHTHDAEVFELVAKGDLEELKLLIKKGARLNHSDYDNRNGLHVACCTTNIEMIKYLVESGVALNQRDAQNQTPLYEAICVGDKRICEYLRERGAVNISGIVGSKLCQAAVEGNLMKLSLLLKNNDDLNVADYDARTALHLACCEGKMDVVRWLIEHDASPLVKDRWGHTPLDEAHKYGHRDIIHYLEKKRPRAKRKGN